MATKRAGLELIISALDRAAAPLDQVNKRLNAMQAPIQRVNRAFQNLSRVSGLQRIQRSMVEVGRASSRVFGEISRLGRMFFRLALLQGVVGFFFQRFISGAVRAGDELDKLSEQTGVSVEALQTLSYAADLSGVSQEAFNKGVARFNKTLGELKAGSGTLFTLLNKVDVGFLKTLQGTTDTEEAMRLFIDRMRKIPDASARAALATAVFGRSAGNMANLAKLSAEELAALEDEARGLGILTRDQTKGAAQLADEWMRVTRVFNNIKNIMAAEFFPVLKDLSAELKVFLIENRPALQEFARNMALKLPEAIQKLKVAIVDIKEVFSDAIAVIAWLNDRGLTLKRSLQILAVLVGGKLILATLALTKAVISLGLAFALTPIGLLTIGLAGLVFAAKTLIDNWSQVVDWFKNLSWVQGLMGALNMVANTLGKIMDTVGQIPGVSRIFGGSQVGTNQLGAASVPPSNSSITRDANVRVSFDNMPRGARASVDRDSEVDIDLDVMASFSGAMP